MDNIKETTQLIADLSAMHALLSRPGVWTQGSYARNAKGMVVNVFDDDAAKWCLLGACGRVAGVPRLAGLYHRDLLLARALRDANNGISSLADWNDNEERKIEDVLALIARARNNAIVHLATLNGTVIQDAQPGKVVSHV